MTAVSLSYLLVGALLPKAGSAPTDTIPLNSLTRKQWHDFARLVYNGKPDTVTTTFRLGAFEMTVRRLCDLGVMSNPRVTRFRNRQVWDADWMPPHNLKGFQDNPTLQYELFTESIRQYGEHADLLARVGTRVDNCEITLSGALMVAHRAGLPGLLSWSSKPDDRKKFLDNTTQHFQRANGLF